MQHCTRNGEPNDFVNVSTQTAGNFTGKFKDGGALVCTMRGPLGRNRCWQSFRAAAAKLAFQDEMVSMAGLWRGGGVLGVRVLRGFEASFVCGEDGGGRICWGSEISEAIAKMKGPLRSRVDGHAWSWGEEANLTSGCW